MHSTDSLPLSVRSISVFVLITLIATALLFGGRYEPACFVTQALILASFFAWINSFCLGHTSLEIYKPLAAHLFLFAVFVGLAFIQSLRGVAGIEAGGAGSIYAERSFEQFVQLLLYLIFFIVSVRLTVHRRWVDFAGNIMGCFVFFLCFAGLMQRMSDAPILWRALFKDDKNIFGPFTLENDFGAYLALSYPWMLAILHYRIIQVRDLIREQGKEAGDRLLLRERFDLCIRHGVVLSLIFLALSIVACFIALSRSALLVILFSSVIYFSFYALRSHRIKMLLAMVVILGLIMTGLYVLADEGMLHEYGLASLKSALLLRIEIARQSLNLLSHYPLFGTGLGTYAFISATEVSVGANQTRFLYAVNDYVELLTDMGIIGAALFLAAMGGFIVRLLFRRYESGSRWKQIMRFQAGLAVVNLLLLEATSFHLKVPAIALLFVLQCALWYTTSFSSSHLTLHAEKIKSKWHHSVVIILCILSGLVFFVHVGQSWMAYHAAHKTNRLEGLKQAVAIKPKSAEYWFQLATEFEKSAVSQNNKSLLENSVSAIDQAVRLAPTYAHYRYYKGSLLYRLGEKRAAIDAFVQSVERAGNFYRYHIFLLKIYLIERARSSNLSDETYWNSKILNLYSQIMNLKIPPGKGPLIKGLGKDNFKNLTQVLRSLSDGPPIPNKG